MREDDGRALSGVPVHTTNDSSQFVICSELMIKLLGLVKRIAPSSAAVLITGETGVGKEWIAQSVHRYSLRRNQPWIDVNCAALPEHLVESELFGYDKGAFSGADSSKPGLFELANKGTLFLDEIGELDPRVQVKLLRVLDGAPYYRLGGKQKVLTNVRIITATNQSLEDAVRTGRFRPDLYHRLAQFQLRVPPLRERPEEIVPLVEHFLRQENLGLRIPSATADVLLSYSWPGNIRELRNVILQASARADNGEILPGDLPPELLRAVATRDNSIIHDDRLASGPHAADLEGMERQAILEALGHAGGHQGMAANQLGISRRTLSRKLKQYRTQGGDGDNLPALGRLSPEQQTAYRTSLQIPVELSTAAGTTISATSANLSEGGISVSGLESPLTISGMLDLRFTLPDGNTVQARGRAVWADPQGRAGVQFLDMSSRDRGALRAWLRRQQAADGWGQPAGDAVVSPVASPSTRPMMPAD